MSSNWDSKPLRFLVGCPSDGAACLKQVLSNSRLKLSVFSFQKLFLSDGFALQLKESKFRALSAGKTAVMENCVNIFFLFPSPPVPRKLPQSPGLKTSLMLRPIYKKYCPACWHTPMDLSAWRMLQALTLFIVLPINTKSITDIKSYVLLLLFFFNMLQSFMSITNSVFEECCMSVVTCSLWGTAGARQFG